MVVQSVFEWPSCNTYVVHSLLCVFVSDSGFMVPSRGHWVLLRQLHVIPVATTLVLFKTRWL